MRRTQLPPLAQPGRQVPRVPQAPGPRAPGPQVPGPQVLGPQVLGHRGPAAVVPVLRPHIRFNRIVGRRRQCGLCVV